MKLTTRETAIFAMLGAVMYSSKLIMELFRMYIFWVYLS